MARLRISWEYEHDGLKSSGVHEQQAGDVDGIDFSPALGSAQGDIVAPTIPLPSVAPAAAPSTDPAAEAYLGDLRGLGISAPAIQS